MLQHRSVTAIAASGLLFASLGAPQAARAGDICGSIINLVSRPTVTNAACTVNPNHTLIETGYTNLSSAENGNNVAYPQTLVRVGTSIRHLEIQFTPPSIVRSGDGRGTADSGAGVKYLFHESQKYLLSAQLNANLPTGDDAFSAGASQTVFAVNGSYTLSPVFAIASTQAFTAAAGNGLHYGTYAPTLVVTASLPRSASAIFAEYSLQTHATGAGTPSRTQYTFGVAHDLGSRLQLDLEAITSPSSSVGKNHGIGVGASYLL